jgi:hypothetical protein
MHITPTRNSAATKMRGGYNAGTGIVAILPIARMCTAQPTVSWPSCNRPARCRRTPGAALQHCCIATELVDKKSEAPYTRENGMVFGALA